MADDRERDRDDHNQRLLKEHLKKLKQAPAAFSKASTRREELFENPKHQNEWEEFKRRYSGKLMQRTAAAVDPLADYKLLGVAAKASPAEIRRAFLGKAKTAHPDHGGNPDAFRELMAAYHRLTEGKG